METGSYENMRRLVYGAEGSEYEGATFIPVCSQCGRFVKADPTIGFCNDTVARQPNSTCKKCGRVEMIFEGFCSGDFGE
jgi:hypothetical protein